MASSSSNSRRRNGPVLEEEEGAVELEHLEKDKSAGFARGSNSLESESNSDFGDPEAEQWLHTGSQEKEELRLYSSVEESSVLKKLDRHLVLFLAVLYMLSFLDRSSMLGLQLSFGKG